MNRAARGLLIAFAAAGPAFGQDWPARADAGVRGALTEQGVEPEPGPPEALGDRMRADIAKWQDVIVSAGIHE
jgi:hypothetical protein